MFKQMTVPHRLVACVLWALSVPVISGCGGGVDGPELAPVEGVVTLDGAPLPNAKVQFQPSEGRPSYGTTDSNGQYRLIYTENQPGAVIGKHTVRITTGGWVTKDDGSEEEIPEKLPIIYHTETELSADVESGGINKVDFKLASP